ncbi:MAG: N-acetylglutaminylglutamine amidotransferase [Gemmatimonadales bacterium]|jgi:asparagine synthase (glutamine-hydrolysing)
MCGLCGVIRFDGAVASSTLIGAMTEAMWSRGPDAGGSYCQNGAGFGHRRLKIIDVSERARQPMLDSDLGIAIVYNGAVYNYPELRARLEAKGYRFFSSGDTEVVLKAYHAWGEHCVQHLNGMFAFAVWEIESGRVFLARDRLGIKPLYYAETNHGLLFASSLPALLRAGGIDTDIDPVALHHYMTFHSVVPPPRTILAGVRKLPPATTLTIEPSGTQKLERYWQLSFERDAEEATYGFEDWSRLLVERLQLSVQRRLLADVPVGVLLSGGLDSSLVVGLLCQAGQSGLNTFSIGFEGVGEEEGNEFRYSDIVAETFETHHHKIQVDSSRVLPALDACVEAMSEPMVSHDCIGFYLLSEEVSRHVKVVQSGQGADEVLAGYYWYPPLLDSEHPVDDYAKVFFDRSHEEYGRAVSPRFTNGNESRAFVERHFETAPASRPIDKALHLDTTVMLVDDPVKRVDNMTMAWGLEARVPFLDHELVELAARIPAELKVRNGGKYILKEIARSIIPTEVIDRPKGYFPVPALKYLRGDYLDHVRRILEAPAARQRELFRKDYVDQLLRDPESNLTPLRGSKLWQLALLEYWLQTHNV